MQNQARMLMLTNSMKKFISKSWFLINLHEIYGCHGNVKNDTKTVDISTFSRRMNEQLLKVSASHSK